MTDARDWILLVDDDEDIRDALEVVLTLSGYRAVGAYDGLDALDRLRRAGAPGLILLDLMMPRLNGVGLAEQLKLDHDLRDVPIVVLSGDSAAGEIAETLGARACLKKPVDLDDLLAVVKRFVPSAPLPAQPTRPSLPVG